MTERILVSGASGFIAGHTIERLLAKGYDVTGTVRDPGSADKTAHLTSMPGAADHLTLVAADLTDDDPFGVHADLDVIMHMASPYIMNVKDAQRDLVDPAVKGTISVLEAAANASRVRRVVLTSSMAAVTDEPDGRVLTERDWNTKSSLTRNPYYFSKTQAERAAWDFMEREKPVFDLVVINPFLVIGPAHTSAINTSNQILADIIAGTYPAVMALTWGMVDVRDVADAHIAAMENNDASGRYVCASDTVTMAEVVDTMREAGWGHTKLPKLQLTGGLGTSLGVAIDAKNRLWVIDPGNHGAGQPRLIGFDLATDNVVHTHNFESAIAPLGSFLQDLQVSTDGRWIYIADVGFWAKRPGIVVYDVERKQARRLLTRHDSVYPQNILIRTQIRDMSYLGGILEMKTGIDGIALSRDDAWLYYGAMNHSTLFRVPTEALRDTSLEAGALERMIEPVGAKPLNDGLSIDDENTVYITDVEHQAVIAMTPDGGLKTIVKDGRIRWADGLSFGPDGWLYLADSAIPHLVLQDAAHHAEQAPYYVWRFKPGAHGAAGQ